MPKHVLVVEDEAVVARDMKFELEALGVSVLGPVATVEAAMELMAANSRIDAAVLDIALEGEMVYPVARRLRTRKVPFVFYTGYVDAVMPIDLSDLPRIRKPASSATVALSLEALYRDGGKRLAPGTALADIYLARSGEYMVRVRSDGTSSTSAEALVWLGAGEVDLGDWAIRLRLPLQPGVFYCVPKRYVGMLRQAIQILG